MILNNYLKLKACVSQNMAPNTTPTTFPINMVDINGVNNRGCYGFSSPNDFFNTDNWALMKGLKLRLGTGTTEPTLNDNALVDDVTGSFTNIQTTVNTGCEDNKIKTVITMSATSNSANEITIREVGVTKSVCYNYASGTSWPFQFVDVMMVRELLEEPIVVPARASFSITFAWEEA